MEYLTILAERYNLRREQIKAMLEEVMSFKAETRSGAAADNADSLKFATLKAWQISELRRCLAELIVK